MSLDLDPSPSSRSRLGLLAASTANTTLVYVGTYTGTGPHDSKGIYAFTFDETTSLLTPLGLSADTPNPSYLWIHPSRQYLYAVHEQETGQISGFRIDADHQGRVTLINHQSSAGSGPCYLSGNRAGSHIFVANYNSGTVAVLPVDGRDGTLKEYTGFDRQIGSSVNRARQQAPYAHSIRLDRTESHAISANLGSDQIYSYQFFTGNGSLSRSRVDAVATPGDGPRHFVVSANNEYVYVLNELTSTVTVYRHGFALRPTQTISTVPSNWTSPNTGAEILLHPTNESFLYVSNRGHDSLAVYSVDTSTGRLTLVQHVSVQGRVPRHFNILPDGKHLIVANQGSNNLVVFSVDPQTGRLAATGSTAPISKPTCIQFL